MEVICRLAARGNIVSKPFSKGVRDQFCRRCLEELTIKHRQKSHPKSLGVRKNLRRDTPLRVHVLGHISWWVFFLRSTSQLILTFSRVTRQFHRNISEVHATLHFCRCHRRTIASIAKSRKLIPNITLGANLNMLSRPTNSDERSKQHLQTGIRNCIKSSTTSFSVRTPDKMEKKGITRACMAPDSIGKDSGCNNSIEAGGRGLVSLWNRLRLFCWSPSRYL